MRHYLTVRTEEIPRVRSTLSKVHERGVGGSY